MSNLYDSEREWQQFVADTHRRIALLRGLAWCLMVAGAFLIGYCSGPAHGAELVLHTVSKHSTTIRTTDNQPWEEVNPGIGLRSGPWQAGVYRNSYGRPSVYAIGHLGQRYGVFGGLATGYPAAAVLPLGGLFVRLGPVTLRGVPPVHPKVTAVVAAEIEVKL